MGILSLIISPKSWIRHAPRARSARELALGRRAAWRAKLPRVASRGAGADLDQTRAARARSQRSARPRGAGRQI